MRNARIVETLIPRASTIRRWPRLGAEIVNIRLSADSPSELLCAVHKLVLAQVSSSVTRRISMTPSTSVW